MRHVRKEGSNNQVIITLHGTGGSATDLFQIAQIIDDKATLIGFQGEVSENGMARYFARYQDGTFDERSLFQATYDLKDSIYEIIEQYQLQDFVLTLLGYSNGANLALSYLKEFTNIPIKKVILLHPSPTLMNQSVLEHKDLKTLITTGANDPYMPKESLLEIKHQFENNESKLEIYMHEFGHQITQDEIEAVKRFYLKIE